MPGFTLGADGGQVTLSALRGKNVLIVFFRGYAAENAWCTICHYQYAELVMRELREKVREKYGLDVLFVLPYDKDVVQKWQAVVPEQLEKIKKWKNPADPAALDEAGRRRMERSKTIFPLDMAPADIEAKPGEMARPFPVLMDADRALTKRLGIFATEWGGSKVEQGIPSVYIVDKAGILRFKYIGQTTVDRPSYDYLFKILDCVNAGK
jgi:peroxiredoxin